jgi:hypothetical protein
MRRTTTIRLAILAALIALAGVRVSARQTPAPQQPPAPAQTITKAPAPKAKTGAAKPKATKTKANAEKKKSAAARKKAAAKPPKLKTPSPMTKTAGAAPGASPWRPSNPVAEQLSAQPREVARARKVLPPGTDLNAATAGFRNYSQFTAAVNATESKRLDFARLKALMTGINMDGTRTNRPTMSLSQATQALHGTATTPPPGV